MDTACMLTVSLSKDVGSFKALFWSDDEMNSQLQAYLGTQYYNVQFHHCDQGNIQIVISFHHGCKPSPDADSTERFASFFHMHKDQVLHITVANNGSLA